MKLLVYNEDYIPSIIIQLEDEKLWICKEIYRYLMEKHGALLADIIQLKQELVKLSTNKLSRILSLQTGDQADYLSKLDTILSEPNEVILCDHCIRNSVR